MPALFSKRPSGESPPHTYHLRVLLQGAVMQTASGRRFSCVPVLAFYIADLLETASLTNVLAYPAAFPDPTFLVPKHKLNCFDEEFPLRTEAYHNQASPRNETRMPGLSPFTVVIWLSIMEPMCAAQVIAEAELLVQQGASDNTVAAKLKEAGLRSTDRVGSINNPGFVTFSGRLHL